MRKVGIIFLMISVIGFLGASTRFCGRSSSIRIGETSTVDLNTNMTIDEGTIRIDTGGNITGDGGVYANFSQGVFLDIYNIHFLMNVHSCNAMVLKKLYNLWTGSLTIKNPKSKI